MTCKVTNEQLHEELQEVKGLLEVLVSPLQRIEVELVADEVGSDGFGSLDEWNMRHKQK